MDYISASKYGGSNIAEKTSNEAGLRIYGEYWWQYADHFVAGSYVGHTEATGTCPPLMADPQ